MSTKEFIYKGQTFVGFRKLFGEGGYYLMDDGPEKTIRFKGRVFSNVDDVIAHALGLLEQQDS